MNLEEQIKQKIDSYKDDPEYIREEIDFLEGEIKAILAKICDDCREKIELTRKGE